MITISRHAEVGERRQDAELRADEPEHADAVRADAGRALQRPPRGLRLRVAVGGLERAEPRALPDAAVPGREDRQPGDLREALPAAYKGIKAGNPLAEVGDRRDVEPRPQQADRQAAARSRPRRSRACSSQVEPKLPFVAWATHPYPTETRLGPNAERRLPERDDDAARRSSASRSRSGSTAACRSGSPSTASRRRPEYPGGVSLRAAGGRREDRARAGGGQSPYVEMFVWFIIKDTTDKTWNSGLVTKSGDEEAVVRAFAKAAKGIDGQAQMVAAGQVADDQARHPVPDLRQRGRARGSASPTRSSTARRRSRSGSRSARSRPTRPSRSWPGSSR